QYDSQASQKTAQIHSLDAEIQELENTKNNFSSLSQDEVDKLNNEILNLNQVIAAIRHKLSEVDSHNKNLDYLKSDRQKLESENNILRLENEGRRLTDFINNPESNCPTCGHEVDLPDLSQPKAQLSEVEDSLQMYVNQSKELYGRIEDKTNQIAAFVVSDANE